MALMKTRWLLSILLLNFLQCCSTQGPPRPPSRLYCSRSCDETDCPVDIHCVWDEGTHPRIPTNYTLSWQSAYTSVKHAFCGTRSNGVILRKHYVRHDNLQVWVQATNQYGFSESEKLVITPEDIIKPPAPKLSSSCQDPLEISWITACDQLQLFAGTCEVRYWTEEHPDWLQYEDGLQVIYSVIDPIPGTVYAFQVRCNCQVSLVSDWSDILHIKSAETAPVGEVDVWSDCGILPTSNSCSLTWKSLPASQAHGNILAYEIKMSYKNGSEVSVIASTNQPSSHFVLEEENWCLRSPLKNVSSVSVTAINTVGATQPVFLTMPPTGKEGRDGVLQLKINEENLTVSWDLRSQFPNPVNKSVVQYKEAGRPAGQGFGWKSVNGNQTVTFKGHFKKYTPYQVSLFQVLNTGEVKHITSDIGYFLQKAPSTVPSLKVVSIEEAKVTLEWETVPLTEQNGLISYYQVGVDSQEVLNVSVPQHLHKKSLQLKSLRPAQDYEAWVRAVNAAGPGPSVTVRFKTQRYVNLGLLFGFLFALALLLTFCICAVYCACRGLHKACPLAPWVNRVPDPCNSLIFAGIKHQINDSLSWICIPTHESHPNISHLEILEKKPEDSDPDKLNDGGATARYVQEREDAGRDWKNSRCNGKDYSEMIDSDEDRDCCWSSSEEEQCPSGYEAHFMPTAAECGIV